MSKKKEKTVTSQPSAETAVEGSFTKDVTAAAQPDPEKKGRSQKKTKVKALKTFTYRYGRFRYRFVKGELYPVREEIADHLRMTGRVM